MPRAAELQIDFSRGQNNGLGPFLSNSSYHEGINVHARRGYIEPRKADIEIRLTDTPQGRYQGSAVYNPGTGDRLIVISAGNIYEIWPTGVVRAITEEPALSTTAERCYFVQANNYLIIQDGINLPVVLEDGGYSISETVPIGRWMTAGNGYLAVVAANCRTIWVSNISTFLDDPSIILEFSETPNNLVPFDIGDIVGLHLAPILDAGTAMGALLAFGSRGRVFAYDLTIPRDQWGATAGFGRIIAEGIFLASNDSIQAIGGDLYMRTRTGLDTLNLARSDWQASRNRSISQPIDGWLDQDPQHLLRVCQAAYWDSRYHFTTRPIMRFDGPEIIHGAAVVYDVSHGIESAPAYPGIEVGAWPLAFHVIDGALMTLGKAPEGGLRLFRRPARGSHTKCRIPWRIDTRAFDWRNPAATKSLLGGDSYVHIEFGSPGDVQVSFRTDASIKWHPLTTITSAPCDGGGTFQRHSDNFEIPSLPEVTECDRTIGASFHWLQLRFEGDVPVRIREIYLEADVTAATNPLESGIVSHYLAS